MIGSSRRDQLLLFARNFFKHPKMLGSLIPSSRFLIRRLLAQIDWGQATTIVEYGAGVGTFTTEVLRRMRPDGLLIAFETNPDFVEYLQTSIRDPRLHIEHRSAEEVEQILRERGRERADYVISGIPFSTMPEQLRTGILRSTHRVLQPNGVLLVYQFSPKVQGDLKRIFGRVEHTFELLNILPAHVFYCYTS